MSDGYARVAPNFSRKMRAPMGVTSNALLPAMRRVQPLSRLCAQIAAPTAPARCGRRSLQSRQGRRRTRPDRCGPALQQGRSTHAQPVEEFQSRIGDNPCIAGQLDKTARGHCIGQRHPQLPGNVIVEQVRAFLSAASFGPTDNAFRPGSSSAATCMMLSSIRAIDGAAKR